MRYGEILNISFVLLQKVHNLNVIIRKHLKNHVTYMIQNTEEQWLTATEHFEYCQGIPPCYYFDTYPLVTFHSHSHSL